MRYRTKLIAVLMAVTLLMGGCASVPGTDRAEPDLPSETLGIPGGNIFSVSVATGFMDYFTVYMDSDGNVLDDSTKYFEINDAMTRETRYRCEYIQTDTGEDDEWGNPVTDYWSRVYDLDGSLVVDWAPYTYSGALGKYLLRHEYSMWWEDAEPSSEGAGLYDTETGEIAAPGTSMISKIDEHHAGCEDWRGAILYITDENGKILVDNSGADREDNIYCSTDNGHILENISELSEAGEYIGEKNRLYDCEYNLIYESDNSLNISFYGLRGPYFMERTDHSTQIRSIETAELLDEYYRDPSEYGDLRYYDGELTVTGSRGSDYFVRKGDETIAGPFSSIDMADGFDDTDEKTEGFIVIDGDKAELIDRNGNAVKEKVIENLESIYPDGQFYTYTVGNDYSWTGGIMDRDFETIISPDEGYMNFYSRGDESGTVIVGSKEKNGNSIYTLFDEKGNVICDNILDVGTYCGGRIAVRRGNYVGIIGMDGEWIKKNSVYDLKYFD